MQTVQEIQPMTAGQRPAVIISDRLMLLAGVFALLILFAWIFPQTGDGDAVMHFLNAHDSLSMPAKLMGSWARVGDKLPLLIPAQFGVFVAHCTCALISVLCAWQTIRFAEDLELPHANLAAVFFIFQPFVFSLAADTMTEIPFALGTIIAIRLWMNGRFFASSMVVGYLPIVRPEGFFLCALWGVMIVARHRPRWLFALAWGTAAWFVACWILMGDPSYFYREGWSWPADSLRVYGHGSFFAHVNRWPIYCGPVLLALFVMGLRWNKLAATGLAILILEIILPAPIRENVHPWAALALAGAFAWNMRKDRFALGTWVFLLIFTLHSVLWWRGWFGSCGLMRILACVAPITALVCLRGWNRIAPQIPGYARSIALGAIVLTAIAYYLADPLHWRIFPLDRAAQFASQHHLIDNAPMLIFGEPMAQAALNMHPNPPNILPNNCDRMAECRHLLHAPTGSIGFWDNQHAAAWFGVPISDLPGLGYTILYQTRQRPIVAIEWLEPAGMARDQIYVVIRKDRAGELPRK